MLLTLSALLNGILQSTSIFGGLDILQVLINVVEIADYQWRVTWAIPAVLCEQYQTV